MTGKPFWYVTNNLDQLSLPSLRGRLIEYRPLWLALRRGEFTCVGWQITLWNIYGKWHSAALRWNFIKSTILLSLTYIYHPLLTPMHAYSTLLHWTQQFPTFQYHYNFVCKLKLARESTANERSTYDKQLTRTTFVSVYLWPWLKCFPVSDECSPRG